MRALSVTVLYAIGCASSGAGGAASRGPEHVAPAPAAADPEGGEAVGGGGGGGGGDEHEPQVVHTGKKHNLEYDVVQERYSRKGNKCGGDDAPERAIGEPDQKNEMQIGRDHVVTYGYRYKQGTLMIRCRNEHVESLRSLGHTR
jgi:hypothetical protein